MIKFKVTNTIIEKIRNDHLVHFSRLGNTAFLEKVSIEYLSMERINEQIVLLERYSGSIVGKKILEIGSGYGGFVTLTNLMGAEAYGIEPCDPLFSETLHISKELLVLNNINDSFIVNAMGEKLPFLDNYFDIVYSTSVLEHVKDPARVIYEGIRVLKPGGILQFVLPNYGSFWEGHYMIYWIPYIRGLVAKCYIRLWNKDPYYVDELQFLNYFLIKKILSKCNNIEIISFGEEIFMKRMNESSFSTWAGLDKLKRIVNFLHRIKIVRFITLLLIFFKAYTPIVLTIKKLDK